MITRAQTQAEIDEQEFDAAQASQRELNPLPTFEEPIRTAPSGPVSDVEMARHLAKMIRQLLFGYNLAELEAMAVKNSVEGAEGHNVDVHNATVAKLKQLADKFDPPQPQQKLTSLAQKMPSLPMLMPALRRPIR